MGPLRGNYANIFEAVLNLITINKLKNKLKTILTAHHNIVLGKEYVLLLLFVGSGKAALLQNHIHKNCIVRKM